MPAATKAMIQSSRAPVWQPAGAVMSAPPAASAIAPRYEAPEKPEIHFKTLGKSAEEMVDALEHWLNERDIAEDQYDSGGGI